MSIRNNELFYTLYDMPLTKYADNDTPFFARNSQYTKNLNPSLEDDDLFKEMYRGINKKKSSF